jgi:hypothetical protein
MDIPMDYTSRADECVRIARKARPRERAMLLEIAKTWLKLAELARDDDDALWVNGPGNHLHS